MIQNNNNITSKKETRKCILQTHSDAHDEHVMVLLTGKRLKFTLKEKSWQVWSLSFSNHLKVSTRRNLQEFFFFQGKGLWKLVMFIHSVIQLPFESGSNSSTISFWAQGVSSSLPISCQSQLENSKRFFHRGKKKLQCCSLFFWEFLGQFAFVISCLSHNSKDTS